MSRYIKTPIITCTSQLVGLQRGQWVKLAWADKPSRLFNYKPEHQWLTHWPHNGAFNEVCKKQKLRKLINLSNADRQNS